MCFTKEIWTFIFWWLITFEPLEQKQSYIPLLKVLMCGMNARGTQRHDGTSILPYTSLKRAVLLHKIALVNFPMATTVYTWYEFSNYCYSCLTKKSSIFAIYACSYTVKYYGGLSSGGGMRMQDSSCSQSPKEAGGLATAGRSGDVLQLCKCRLSFINVE